MALLQLAMMASFQQLDVLCAVCLLLQGHSGYHVAPYMPPFDSPDNRVCCGAPQEVRCGHAVGVAW
jgi:hypothetical protein